jgi:folate-binding protein YgfZ
VKTPNGTKGIRDFLIDRGASVQGSEVIQFSDPLHEYRTLSSAKGALLIPLLNMTPIRVNGNDRIDFVNGQVSNQVKELNVGGVNQSLLLNHRGHVQAEMSVIRREKDIYLAVEGPGGPGVVIGFNKHIVFDQVVIENLESTIGTFTLQGEAVPQLLKRMGALPREGYTYEGYLGGVKVLVHARVRTALPGFDIHFPASDFEEILSGPFADNVVLGGTRALQIARVEAGIPSVATEARDGALPQEFGLVGAVSFDKGCYLGQEIMARLDARGRVKRGLAGVTLERKPHSGEYRIDRDGRPAGWLGQVVEHPRIGLIGLTVLRNDFPLGGEGYVGGARVRRVDIPFDERK